jgi:transcriptional antiterminator NusG
VSSQPDSTADNTPEVVDDTGADNPEAGLPTVADETSPADVDASQDDSQDDSAQPSDQADAEPAADTSEPVEEAVTEAEEEVAVDEAEAEAEAEADEDEEEEDLEETEEAVVEEEEEVDDGEEEEAEPTKEWYILKVQVNRENSIRDALERRSKIAGLEEFIDEVVVPTEEVAEFNKAGKRRIVKKKLFPGYIMVHMIINDDTWFLVRETPGIGDFTGAGGKPTPMDPFEVERILKTSDEVDDGDQQVKTAIPFKTGDRVRVKDGYFLNFEGEVEGIDEANGRVTVMINIFGRSTPVELEHWQIEDV